MTKSTATTLIFTLPLVAALALHSGAADAQLRPVGCTGPGNTLQQPAVPGVDLIINKACTVNVGTYKFGNVNIVKGGTLKFTDAVIDFWAASILVENGGTLTAGALPDPPIGTNNGRLTIHLWGKDQTGDDPARQGKGIPCISDYDIPCGIPSAIWKSNVDHMGMPVPVTDARKISALGADVARLYPPGQTDDYFYAYAPLEYDGRSDTTQTGTGYVEDKVVGFFGYKVLGVSYGGSLQLFGKKGATYPTGGCPVRPPTSSETSWARLNATARVNATQLIVDRQLTLEKGDQIVVTTTDYLPGHSEQLTVAQDVICGTTIDVLENLKYEHSGQRFPLPQALAGEPLKLDASLVRNGAETRAAVGVLTRSIRIVSEGDTLSCPAGTSDSCFPDEPPAGSSAPGYYFGGHVVVRQGVEKFQIQGVEFKQLGQGGRIGHYPVHFHHVRRAPPDTFVRDSSVHDSMTRWVVLHGTQEVKLERNVGYKSIGHGYYLEGGTEINNTLTANLGVFARAAIANDQNPRKVPGILAASNLHDAPSSEDLPYRSDYDHPTVFWIMNGWNDFKDNMAAGAGTCGVCYWLLPAINSTMSRDMKWSSYASMQSDPTRAGTAPLKSFIGNSCTSAMTSFQTISKTEACQGVGPVSTMGSFLPTVQPVRNALAPISVPPPGSSSETVAAVTKAVADYYPQMDASGGHFPTKCVGKDGKDGEDCSAFPNKCSPGNTENCMVTVLDRYTTSFNWAPFNFAAIWLRPQWYLVTDSVIADVQQAGLTMVTGGGYTESDVIPGHWALVRKSVFIGNTQDCPTCANKKNPYASNGGPFNPDGLKCAVDRNGNRPGGYCLSIAEGVSHQMSNFGMYQRLFSVYDGPAFQDSNAYLNIKPRVIDDCAPFDDVANLDGTCRPKANPNARSAWIAGMITALRKETPPASSGKAPYCYMPNAAIGWKQPNGFYYPPAFHSRNLFFDNVDFRHFVISPLFKEGTHITDTDQAMEQFCVWNKTMFDGWADNDRQTVLNDDDGTLTGYAETTVINRDPFFAAPVDATQCLSDESSRTSPYEYVTTVVYPGCAYDGTCARDPAAAGDPDFPNPRWNDGDWNASCTSELCYGVPLWRQNLMPIADKGIPKSIRMMGQETGQRSSLTVNHGTYYIDTTLSREAQIGTGCKSTNPAVPCVGNVFKANQSYYLFLIFAKETTEQTYRFYVGKDTGFDPASITMVRAPIAQKKIKFTDIDPSTAKPVAGWLHGDPNTGVVEVRIVVKDYPGVFTDMNDAEVKKCQPATFCKWNADFIRPGQAQKAPRCEGVDAAGAFNGQTDICSWPIVDQDCPANGCVGIKFTLPAGFATRTANDPNPLPEAVCIDEDSEAGKLWNVPLKAPKLPDGTCPKPADLHPRDFLSADRALCARSVRQ